MKRLNVFVLPLLVLILAGCGASKPLVQRPYDPQQDARIRIFGSNGLGISYYENQVCIPKAGGVQAIGGWGQSFQSLLGVAESKSIGIPETGRAPTEALAAKEYFNEYVIQAERPLVLSMAFSKAPTVSFFTEYRCGTFNLGFTPEAGKDYEAFLRFDNGRKRCEAHIREIVSDGATKAVSLFKAPSCPRREEES